MWRSITLDTNEYIQLSDSLDRIKTDLYQLTALQQTGNMPLILSSHKNEPDAHEVVFAPGTIKALAFIGYDFFHYQIMKIQKPESLNNYSVIFGDAGWYFNPTR